MQRSSVFSLPNLLSFSRLPLAAVFVLSDATPVRVALVGAASATDMLDGWLARRGGRATRTGALLDPVADKTFMLAAFGAFLARGEISVAALALILMRDIATAVGFLVAAVLPGLDPRSFRARWPGKAVTILQLAALLVLLLRPAALRWLLPLIAATSVLAIADYTRSLARARSRARA